jgi:hypothetical protein
MRRREYCEACLSIDVRRLSREAHLWPAVSHGIDWQREGQVISSATIVTGPDHIKLIFRYQRTGSDSTCNHIEQKLPLVWSTCAFGGRRPWFLCPGANDSQPCGRRSAILYLAWTPYFACRHCHNLAYASQFEPIGQRGIQRARSIRMKLGGGPSLFAKLPAKPKRMHARTYSRLCSAYEKAAVKCGALPAKLAACS